MYQFKVLKELWNQSKLYLLTQVLFHWAIISNIVILALTNSHTYNHCKMYHVVRVFIYWEFSTMGFCRGFFLAEKCLSTECPYPTTTGMPSFWKIQYVSLQCLHYIQHCLVV